MLMIVSKKNSNSINYTHQIPYNTVELNQISNGREVQSFLKDVNIFVVETNSYALTSFFFFFFFL
jgi:hypothetical protein